MVQFFPWFKIYFPMFFGMVMYDNGLKQKKIKFKPWIKLIYNIYNAGKLISIRYIQLLILAVNKSLETQHYMSLCSKEYYQLHIFSLMSS